MHNNISSEQFKTAFSSILQATFKFQTAYQKVIKNVVNSFNQTFKNIKISSEAIYSHKYAKLMTDIGYPLHMFYNKTFFNKVVTIPKSDVSQYINQFFNNRRINAIYNSWGKMKFIKQDRLPILKEAINMHKKGFYYSSVSILMCQFSSIIQDNYKFLIKQGAIFDDDFVDDILKHFDIDKMKKDSDKGRLCQQLSYMTKGGLFQYEFLKYLNDYVLNSNKQRLKNNPNRNKICHGEYLKYNTWEHSLKSILVIDGLLRLPNIFVMPN